MSSSERTPSWRFLSNHTQVLLCLNRNPDARFRDLADSIGITERTAQGIVADLIDTGYRQPRTNRTTKPLHAQPRAPPCATPPSTATTSANSSGFFDSTKHPAEHA